MRLKMYRRFRVIISVLYAAGSVVLLILINTIGRDPATQTALTWVIGCYLIIGSPVTIGVCTALRKREKK